MTFNRILAAVALLLAGGALIVRTPERNAYSDPSSLAALIETEKDHIEPLELARSIKEGKQKIQLIDLRDSTVFAQYHIPGARLMTLTTLVNGGVHRNENIVIYSQGGTHAAQAWVILKTKNFPNVRTLLGGMSGWKEEILYPQLSPDADDAAKHNFEERKTLSLFFGGQPKTAPSHSGTPQRQKPPSDGGQPPPKFEKEEDKLRETCSLYGAMDIFPALVRIKA
jgi:rhodanese-related sulfurtransferase